MRQMTWFGRTGRSCGLVCFWLLCSVSIGEGQTGLVSVSSSPSNLHLVPTSGVPVVLVAGNPVLSPPAIAATDSIAGSPSVSASVDASRLEIRAKDSLDANDRTIGRVAVMYESFARLITIFLGLLTTIVTVIAALFGFFAFRSLRDYQDRWDKELIAAKGRLCGEIDALKELAARRVRDAVASISENESKVQESVARAEAAAVQLEERQDVLNDYLSRYDALAARVEELQEIMRGVKLLDSSSLAPLVGGMSVPTNALVDRNEAEAVSALVGQKVKQEVTR